MGSADQQRRGAAPTNRSGTAGWLRRISRFVEQEPDELAYWHRQLKGKFELGTLYTMVAGLLNVLAIYDAYAGPVFISPEEKRKLMAKSESQSDKGHRFVTDWIDESGAGNGEGQAAEREAMRIA